MSRAVKLSFDLYKSITAPNQNPILIFHGLLGCKRNWRSIANALNNTGFGQVYCVDARNHGTSPQSNEMNYKLMAEDILQFVADLKVPKASLIGHSMGGKASMTAALMEPSMIDRLVVVDIAPAISPNKANTDLFISLMHCVDLESKMSEAGNLYTLRANLMKEWEKTIPSYYQRAFILTNLYEEDGKAGWRVNAEAIHANMKDLFEFPFPEDSSSPKYQGPALFVSGEKSAFLTLDQMSHVYHFFPQAKRIEVPGAGHWVNADAPEYLTDILTKFLK